MKRLIPQLLSAYTLSLLAGIYSAPCLAAPPAAPASAASQDDCSAVRLDAPGGPMEFSKMPVLNQGNTPLCFAYAAAQMIDAYRFSHDTKQPKQLTSPLALATQDGVYNNEFRTKNHISPLEGGMIWMAIGAGRRAGSCSYEAIQKLPGSEELNSAIQELKNLYAYGQARPTASSKLRAPGENTDEVADLILCKFPVLETLSSSNKTIVRQLKAALRSRSVSPFLKEVIDLACKNHTTPLSNLPAPEHLDADEVLARFPGEKASEHFIHLIHERLSTKNPQPIGITYCASILFQKNREKSIFTGDFDYDLNCNLHASVIIGRRKAPDGSCQFLIRNAAGPTCDSYYDPKQCENGQVWVDRKRIGDNLLKLAWIP